MAGRDRLVAALARLSVLGGGIGFAVLALAGRPLSVDDANVDDAGRGHVEAWWGRQPGPASTLSVAPAYSPSTGLELDALISRDRTGASTLTAAQVKWLVTPSRQGGCNLGTVWGASRLDDGTGTTPYFNGIVTCNGRWGSTHANLGAAVPRGQPSYRSWGLAHEFSMGRVTPHLEVFGQSQSKPVFQVGARADIAPGVQIDGTLGRSDGQRLLSLGLKRAL